MDLLRNLPLGLYLEKPVTWLHYLDARVKLAWLMTFLAAPMLASSYCRLGLAAVLCLLTISATIPFRVWRQQMGLLSLLCLFIFLITCFAPDGLAVHYQPRLPTPEQDITQPTSYEYVLFHVAKFKITRRSLDLAVRISTLLFTLIYSSNLYLLTTAPEEITAGLENLLQPAKKIRLPITEIILTLTLSLRFIPLVLEEIQNLSRSVRTRAINWQKLGMRRSFQIWLILGDRLLENLLLRAEQIAIAMEVRGFTSPNKHQVKWHKLKLGWGDWFALGCLPVFWWLRLMFGSIS